MPGGGLAFELFAQIIVASVGYHDPIPNFKTDVIRFIYGGAKVYKTTSKLWFSSSTVGPSLLDVLLVDTISLVFSPFTVRPTLTDSFSICSKVAVTALSVRPIMSMSSA